ncbi:hypothetical protein [Aeromonas veronii]|uniref:hypothetical protein n=1 Tax=Aeromonas veronii TaxID=654 RepID=UPI0031FC058E
MAVSAYVKKKFGTEAERNLRNINRGGSNNRKGGTYEAYFSAAKVCEIAASSNDTKKYLISSQDESFVDDVCVVDELQKHKENYQLKNSSGSAASWNTDIEDRFKKQCDIDINYHQMSSSEQILLVSCSKKMQENKSAIPATMANYCSSRYFPYHSCATRLIYNCDGLRDNLEKICGSAEKAVIDAAYRCVVSAWICEDRPRYVYDIIGKAKGMSKPNVFGALIEESPETPEWLHDIAQAFDQIEVRVICGALIVDYNGLKINLGSVPEAPKSCELKNLDKDRVLSLLMAVSAKALGGEA